MLDPSLLQCNHFPSLFTIDDERILSALSSELWS